MEGSHPSRPDAVTGNSGRTLAEKIDHLFRTVHPAGRGPYSYEEAAHQIEKVTGEKISHNSLWKLRTGRADNPTKRLIEAIADFFGVPPAYFFDDQTAREIDGQLELLALLRDAGIQKTQLRMFVELSEEGRTMVRHMIEEIARRQREPTAGPHDLQDDG